MRPLAAVCLALLCSLMSVAADRPPNVVFILADDLGYADVGCYGQKRIATPHIDRLAASGMRFTQFYAGSTVCAPSRSVLITGQHTGHTTIRGNAKFSLRREDHSVAEVFKRAGYHTALIGKWGLGLEGSDALPLQKGFDYFYGYLDQTHAHNYYPTFLVRNDARIPLRNIVPNEGQYGQGVATKRVDYSAALIADEALGFLQRQTRDEPFFLLYTPTLPHANNEGKPDGMEDPDRGAFDKEQWPDVEKGFAAMVTRLDRDVGRILDQLEKLGVAGNTIVIFTSDNGPHAEGGHDPKFFHSSGPLTGNKRDLTDGGIRVPFIVSWPNHIKAGSTSDHVGYFGDFFATAAELTGTKAPTNLDSLSFLPALLGRTQAVHDFLYWEFFEQSGQAVRFGDWKAIRRPMFTGKIALYNLKADLAEQHDVAGVHPDLVAQATKYMEQSHVPSPLWPDPAK